MSTETRTHPPAGPAHAATMPASQAADEVDAAIGRRVWRTPAQALAEIEEAIARRIELGPVAGTTRAAEVELARERAALHRREAAAWHGLYTADVVDRAVSDLLIRGAVAAEREAHRAAAAHDQIADELEAAEARRAGRSA